MEIAIDRLSIHLGIDIAPERAQAIGGLIGEALQTELRARSANLSAAPAGYYVPSITLPGFSVHAEASDSIIAQMVANALARALLLEVRL